MDKDKKEKSKSKRNPLEEITKKGLTLLCLVYSFGEPVQIAEASLWMLLLSNRERERENKFYTAGSSDSF